MRICLLILCFFITVNTAYADTNIAPNFVTIKDIPTMKKAFFAYLAPIAKAEQDKIIAQRAAIANGELSASKLLNLATTYRLTIPSKKALLDAVDIISTSLILAQAALESNWGRSRFAGYNNYFGIWCFQKGCGVVPSKRNKNSTHEVAKFASPSQSVRYYQLNLNRQVAYKKLRQIRTKLRENGQKISGTALAEGLINYSAIGDRYIKTVQKIIRSNHLTKYD